MSDALTDALAAATNGETLVDGSSGAAPQETDPAAPMSKAEGKRKAVASAPAESSGKSAKLWADPLAALDDEDDESDEAEGEDGEAALGSTGTSTN